VGAHPRLVQSDGRGAVTRRALGRAAACFPVFGFALYPIVFIATANAGVLPLDGIGFVRGVAVAAAIAAALLLMLRLLPWEFEARAAWAGFALLLFVFYQPVLMAVSAAGLTLASDRPVVAAGFAGVSAIVAAAVTRPWRARRRSPAALVTVACVLLAVNLWTQIAHGLFVPAVPTTSLPAPHASGIPGSAPQRDIYYLILDGFGRADILRTYYDLDLAPFTASLLKKGFVVPAGARANYSQTYLSLASTLNLTYLDRVAAAVGRDSADRRPLKQLIDRNALMAAARAVGYRVYAIGSPYSATQTIPAADVCVCPRRGLSELELEALMATPLAALPLERWTYGAHRAAILEGLDTVERLAADPGPTFVFAHVIVPHPPFVFAADGSARPSARRFSFHDAGEFDGTPEEYVQGYRDQTRYLTTRLTKLVERLLAQAGPAPVIVMHGDHGPGSTMAAGSTPDLEERMAIFAAYAFPDAQMAAGGSDVTAVNLARALAREYLAVDAPNLPDASFFSTWEQPYQFRAVAPEAVDARRGRR
jgi:hypothetical protein